MISDCSNIVKKKNGINDFYIVIINHILIIKNMKICQIIKK